MARLRHFAVCVKDLEKAAQFYVNVFDLKRIGREDLEIGSAIYMTDGVINLALLNFSGKAGSKASDIKEPKRKSASRPTAGSFSSISATSATAISSASSRIPTE